VALHKFKTVFEKKYIDLEQMKNLLVPSKKQRYTVKVGNQLKIIDWQQIQCFYSANKSSYLYTIDGRSYALDETLDALEADCDAQHFFRVNRQFVINIEAIMEISVYMSTRLKIKLQRFTEEEIIVSREKVAAFKKWLN